jgi:hypothetical protein
MFWLLLPPSANAQRHLDAPALPLRVVLNHVFSTLRSSLEALRGLIR